MNDIGIKNAIDNSRKELEEKYDLKLYEVNSSHFKIVKDSAFDEIFITEKISDVVIFIKGLEAYKNNCL